MSGYRDTVWNHLVTVTIFDHYRGCHFNRVCLNNISSVILLVQCQCHPLTFSLCRWWLQEWLGLVTLFRVRTRWEDNKNGLRVEKAYRITGYMVNPDIGQVTSGTNIFSIYCRETGWRVNPDIGLVLLGTNVYPINCFYCIVSLPPSSQNMVCSTLRTLVPDCNWV